MSNPESFIDEVNDEVRSERLFALMKRYGWIAVLLVVLLVGGAAYNEWQKASKRSAAQALGDEITTAMNQDEPADRVASLESIEATGDAAAVVALLKGAQIDVDDPAQLAADLDAIAANGDIAPIYRDIAVFKSVLLKSSTLSPDERKLTLSGLANPGSPLRLLAQEQLALIDIETGNTDAALEQLTAILQDAEVTRNLSQRARDLVVALGGDLEDVLGTSQ